MRFGETVRAPRLAKGLRLRALGGRVNVSHASISKVENGELGFGADLTRRLAEVLGGDEELMLLAAEMIPESTRRPSGRHDAFRRIARLDDEALDRVLISIDGGGAARGVERVDGRRGRA